MADKVKPLISLITPVYNTKEIWLRQCLDSVLNQTFQDWELCLCNNGSTNDNIFDILDEYSKKDSRVKVVWLPANKGGHKGLQAALDISSGEYAALLDSDDFIPTEALEKIAQELKSIKPDVLYTDEMITDVDLNPVLPFYKPEYNRYLLCLLHYWGHLTIYRSAVIKRLHIRFYGGSYDYDLALRASEMTSNIHHISEILYYYRTYPDSTSARTREDCLRGGLKTLQEHLDLKYMKSVASQAGDIYQVKFDDGSIIHPILSSELTLIEGDHLMKRLFNL